MAKKFSIANYVLVSILVAIGLFLSFATFKLPFYVNDYAGFAGAISLSYDVGSGQTAVFDVAPISSDATITQEDLDSTVDFVRGVLYSFGGQYNQVGIQNNTEIRVQTVESDTSSDLMEAIGTRTEIIIRGEATEEETKYDIHSDVIKRCLGTYQATSASSTSTSYSYGVYIEFNSLGKDQYKTLTDYVASNGNTVYFYTVDGEQLGSFSGITKQVTTGATFLPLSSVTTQSSANMNAVNILMGSLDVELTLKDNGVTTAYLGYNSVLYVGISLLVAFVLLSIIMVIRYRDLGLISILTGLVNIVLYLFLLQALPIVTLSLSGIIGAVMGYCLTVLCHIVLFEKMKKEYSMGRKISLSFKLAYKGSLFTILDIMAIALIGSLALYFVGFDLLKSFAIGIFIGGLLSIFSVYCVTRLFTKWYLPLNSTKETHLAFKGEASNED